MKKKQQKAAPVSQAEKEQVRARRAVGHDFAICRDEHGRERLAAGTAEAGRHYELASGGKVVRVRNVDPLAGISSLTALQRQAGAQYRNAFEGSQVSGVRGVLLQERVDVGSGAEYFPAALIDRGRAFHAASRAIGQVMGAHWAWLGFSSVTELVELCRRDVGGQVEIMARYIDKAGLAPALLSRDWEKFARGYNGPGYRRLGYHDKLAMAYVRYSSHAGGEDSHIRRLQEQLTRHGFAVSVDGIPGPATRKAIRAFQQANGLAVDGIAGAATRGCLERPPALPRAAPAELPPPSELPRPAAGTAKPGMLAMLVDLILALFRRQ